MTSTTTKPCELEYKRGTICKGDYKGLEIEVKRALREETIPTGEYYVTVLSKGFGIVLSREEFIIKDG